MKLILEEKIFRDLHFCINLKCQGFYVWLVNSLYIDISSRTMLCTLLMVFYIMILFLVWLCRLALMFYKKCSCICFYYDYTFYMILQEVFRWVSWSTALCGTTKRTVYTAWTITVSRTESTSSKLNTSVQVTTVPFILIVPRVNMFNMRCFIFIRNHQNYIWCLKQEK